MHTWATTIMLRWLLGCYVIIIICKQCPVIILHCDNITSLVWSILQYLGRHNEETIPQTRSIAHQLHSNVVRAVKVSDYFSSRVFSFMFQDFLSQLHPWAQQQLDCSEPKHKSMKQLPFPWAWCECFSFSHSQSQFYDRSSFGCMILGNIRRYLCQTV